MEYCFSFNQWSFSSHQKPRRKIPHPHWYIFHKSTGSLDGGHFETEEYDQATPFDLNVVGFERLQQIAHILANEPDQSSTISIISDCLRLYVQAMDERFRYACFLAFWQLAEALTLSETRRGDTADVVKRLAWHGERLGLKASGYTETLKTYSKKRNDIVHRGIREVEDGDVNLLKSACETALQWLMKQHVKCAPRVGQKR